MNIPCRLLPAPPAFSCLYQFICSNVKRPWVSWKAPYKLKWLLLLLLIIKSDVFLFVEVDVYHPLKRVPPLTPQSKSHSGLVSVQLCSSTWPSCLFRRFLTNLRNLAHICSRSRLPSLIAAVLLLCLEPKNPRNEGRVQTKLTVAICVLA